MTRAETIAFNRGIAVVLQLADQSADRLRSRITEKPTRYSFAIEALNALADASLALMLPVEDEVDQVVRIAAE